MHPNDKRYVQMLKRMRAGTLPRTAKRIIMLDAMTFIETEDGGAGSGNFGHSGRPGMVGGSGAGGGKAYRTGSKETGYVSVAKAAAFKTIADNARATKGDYRAFITSMTEGQKNQIRAQHEQSGTKESLTAYTKRLHQIMGASPAKVTEQKNVIVEGKDISNMFVWDRQPFTDPKTGQVIDTPIEAVIHEQGFDGPPKLVNGVEFQKAVEASHFVAQRAFSAPNQKTLDEYRDQLYRGAWYVDCGTGGAQYGKGMYCAANYQGKLTDGIKEEMIHYKSLGESRYGNIQYEFAQKVYRDHIDSVKMPEGFDTGNKQRDAMTDALDVTDLWTRPDSPEYKRAVDWIEKNPEAAAKLKEQFEDAQLIGTIEGERIERMYPDQFREAYPDMVPRTSIETMTLDPSAKIITYNDLMYKHEKYKRDKLNGSQDQAFEKAITSNGVGKENVPDYKRMMQLQMSRFTGRGELYNELQSLKKKHNVTQEALNKMVNDYRETRERMVAKIESETIQDPGVFAASLGYDAINAEGHGASSSYTVILNRTKLIIQEQG